MMDRSNAPATPAVVSVAEAHRALNEATILRRALSRLSMTRNFQAKGNGRSSNNE
jgi:hypothetical protein